MSTETEENTETTIAVERGGGMVYLDPNDIGMPEFTDIRKSAVTDADLKELEQLGLSMADPKVGQLQPIVVAVNGETDGQPYIVIAGRRRTQAAKMYNLSTEGEKIKLQAVVTSQEPGKGGSNYFRMAAHENLQRKNLNAIQQATVYRYARTKLGEKGKGEKGTGKVAEMFRVSAATVSQYEKLLGLPEEVQEKVAAGEMSNDAAFQLMKEPPEHRETILQRAKRKQAEEDRPYDTGMAVEDFGAVADPPIDAPAASPTKPKKAKKAGTLKAKHIRAAAREVTGRTEDKRGRTEILDWFRSQLGPANGHPNGSIHMFCDAFPQWADGGISDKKINQLWDKMVEKADRGTAEKKTDKQTLESKKVEPSKAPKHKKKIRLSAGKPAPKKRAKKK